MVSSFFGDLNWERITPEKNLWTSEAVDPTVKKYLKADFGLIYDPSYSALRFFC
jgi:CHASE1-domain containing sensor protein